MGNFKVIISLTGGNGVDLGKKDGETVNFVANGDRSSDYIIRQSVKQMLGLLQETGVVVNNAEIVHSWGGMVTNLITGIRSIPSEDLIGDEPVFNNEPSDVVPIEKGNPDMSMGGQAPVVNSDPNSLKQTENSDSEEKP